MKVKFKEFRGWCCADEIISLTHSNWIDQKGRLAWGDKIFKISS